MWQSLVERAVYLVWSFGIPIGDEEIPLLVIALLGAGVYLTFRLGFLQIRRLGHGIAVTAGAYDNPDDPGDVSHFQALTTALSATVGIGNIAGVAIAIHWGGPGALFWMWLTAFFGMALKFAEVTLGQHFREVDPDPTNAINGTVAGGPMYYIEKGLGWKPVAMFVAAALTLGSLLGPNAVQANTVADNLASAFQIPNWISGLTTATLVALVIVGGIRRIGRVTAVLAPLMALGYVATAGVILILQADEILPSFGLIFREAFTPSAGVAGTGAGALLTTMMWGVRRGLFSNEAGQGSATIAHAAAQTNEPVSEGVVALLEPLIDTLIVCTMTGLVILTTGVWKDRVPTRLDLVMGDSSYVAMMADGSIESVSPPREITITSGHQQDSVAQFAWHEVAVERLYTDLEQRTPLSGVLYPLEGRAIATDGTVHTALYGLAAESGAPLTQLAFERGLAPISGGGGLIVVIAVFFFGISTSISWSYYGERCVFYLLGSKVIRPYRILFVVMHFIGAITALATVWAVGDVIVGLVTFPNLIAVVALSGLVARLTRDYFERRPWAGRTK